MLNFFSPERFFSPFRISCVTFLQKCNGVMNPIFFFFCRRSHHSVQARRFRLAQVRVAVPPEKISSAIYEKGRFRNCSAGPFISPQGKKKEKRKMEKKSLGRRQKNCWAIMELHRERREGGKKEYITQRNDTYVIVCTRLQLLHC